MARRTRSRRLIAGAVRLAVLLSVLAITLACLIGFDAWRSLHRPIAAGAPVTIVVKRGMSLRNVAGKLRDRRVFRAPRVVLYWRAYARAKGLAGQLKRGEYRLGPDTTPLSLLDAMVAGRVVQHHLTIVPGKRFTQLLKKIETKTAIRHTLKGKTPAQIMAAIGHPDEKPEGRFMPNTYSFTRDTTDVALLKRAYRSMHAFVDKAWSRRAKKSVVKSPYQALILASMIEKETAAPDERAKIAGVFSRRLAKGMRLQSDPTVIYGMTNFDGNITRADLRRDTPYNTYTRAGLPPTPIATPSPASITAALHPAPGKALYFVARGNGHHVFSDTLAGQRAAIDRYQKHGS